MESSTAVRGERGDIHPPRHLVALVLAPSIVIAAVMSLFYFVIRPLFPIVERYYFPEQAQTYVMQVVPLSVHIAFGAVALVLGAWNVVAAPGGTRHRWRGRVYVVCVAIAAPAGFIMAFHAYGGTMAGGQLVSTSGFAVLAVLWLSSTAAGVVAIVRGQRQRHRDWMRISFSLAFAAVTLRVYVVTLTLIGLPTFELLYPLLAWVSWVPNLAVAVWIVRRSHRAAPTLPSLIE